MDLTAVDFWSCTSEDSGEQHHALWGFGTAADSVPEVLVDVLTRVPCLGHWNPLVQGIDLVSSGFAMLEGRRACSVSRRAKFGSSGGAEHFVWSRLVRTANNPSNISGGRRPTPGCSDICGMASSVRQLRKWTFVAISKT